MTDHLDNDKEELKPIPTFDNLYISNHGYVVSKRRTKTIIMKPHLNNGMLVIKVTEKDGSTRNLWIHQEVAKAFIKNPNNHTLVIHKDFDNTNNKSSNLEWTDKTHTMKERIEAHTQSKLKAFAGEVEKAIETRSPHDSGNVQSNSFADGWNNAMKAYRHKIKAIKEKAGIE